MKQQTEIVNQNSRCFGDVFWSSRAVAHEFSGAKVHLRTVKDSILGDVLVMFWVCFCDDFVMFLWWFGMFLWCFCDVFVMYLVCFVYVFGMFLWCFGYVFFIFLLFFVDVFFLFFLVLFFFFFRKIYFQRVRKNKNQKDAHGRELKNGATNSHKLSIFGG